MDPKVNNPGLEALRTLTRGQVHSGYAWAAVMSDGELLCETCVREEYRQIFRATRDGDHTGWAVQGITHSGESESTEQCANCNKTIWGHDDDNVYKLTAPSAWASYLINGDASGLEDDEQKTVDAWIASVGMGDPVSCNDAGFINDHDAYQFMPLAADCQTYTFIKQ